MYSSNLNSFSTDLQKVIEEMDLIKMEIQKRMNVKAMQPGVQIMKRSTIDAGSRRATTMVGFDDVLYKMLDKITGGGVGRQIIPIVGMGGLGKTTLARNIYANPLVKEHFDVCAWSAISQEHDAIKILREILDQVDKGKGGDLKTEHKLGEKLYKYLIGRRYLIVMDDIWSVEAWDKVQRFFPDDGNGSRIVITTTLSNLASQLNSSGSGSLEMKSLDEATSWNLFSKTIFGEGIFPPELVDVGKKIVEGCKGLPLSIVVIGGLLSKSEPTRGMWESVEGNLYTSYNNLPVHIKPCFLYMGIYGEDREIRVLDLILLWVAEGFLKPIHGKSLEEAGEEYLQELVARNLLVVEKCNHHGEVKSFKIHDLLRDLCLREGEKVKFMYLLTVQGMLRGMSSHRRITSTLTSQLYQPFIRYRRDPNPPPYSCHLPLDPAASTVHTLIGSYPDNVSVDSLELLRIYPMTSIRTVAPEYREVDVRHTGYYNHIFDNMVNLRLLHVDVGWNYPLLEIPSSAFSLWNLQTLYLSAMSGYHTYSVLEIWRMPLLRHVMGTQNQTLDGVCCLPPFDKGEVVLQNLQTLFIVRNLMFVDRVLAMIPNIKKLKLEYDGKEAEEEGDYCLYNLHRLHKLRYINLPHSLKKLTLGNTKLPCEDMASKIGCLPLLQVLKLKVDSFIGSEWETVERPIL